MEAIGVFGLKLGSTLSFCCQTNLFSACKLYRFPVISYPRKHAHFVSLKATANSLACQDEANNRNFRKPFPSTWDHQSLVANLDFSQMDALGREIEALKPQVRNMFISSKGIKKKILFTYLLVTLGLAYHFEDEIVETLKDGFQKIEEMMAGEDDLFLGDHGEFKECLTRDPKGILSLYEATHMGTTTDYILDEALNFTLSNLESLSCTCKPNLSRLIRNSLGLPQHKNMEILVAEEFIRFYEKEEDSDLTLLKFSKLNFKFLQLHYLQELKILSKWYKEQDFHSKLPPYYRDVLVELNLHTLTYLEPKLSRVRIFLTKFYTMQIILDDTCDKYASLREVEILVDIFERWDLEDHAMDGLPDYLKSVVKFIFGTFQEFEREIGSNLQLAKWASVDHLPSFEEYLDVAGIEIAVDFTLACVLMAMENICKEEAYEWLKSREKLVRAMTTKARVPNDMFGYEDDMSKGYLTGSVNCYKKQYGVTEEEAFRKLHQLIVEVDKMMNEEILKPINVPRQVLKVVMIDTLRAINVAYDKQDGFTRPDGHLQHITSMYVDL
ncbi:BnaA09g17640D [Brassica napus]|uniref:BnaA09g17640D protein n=1 Tax=Brassica napus TaxID=3708 RepID=A0A078FLH8_BRANA|nr:BnaA09g17640D [Brassica napus]